MTTTDPSAEPGPRTRGADAIDAPARGAVLAFLLSAVAWLLMGGMLGLIASVKLHSPRFLASSAWLTFGRIRPAHENLMLYGWASMAGAAVLLWLTARVSASPLRFPRLLIAAAALWDLAVLAGTVVILGGGRTGVPWLEFPYRAALLIAVASVLVGISAAVSLLDRPGAHAPPRLYLMAAAVGFPWLYTTAAWLTIGRPVGGIAQAVVAAWYADGLMGLWFAAIGLAALYAMLPGLVGRPIASGRVATLGFWSLVMLCAWTGGGHLAGGPVPAWVVTLAIVADVLLLIHVASIAINLLPLLTARPRPRLDDPALGFLAFAAAAYVAAGVLQAVGSLRSVSRITHFTHAEDALAHLSLFGFYSMAMFGAVYLILPRLTGRGWSSRWAIRTHFWCSAGGVVAYWAILTAAGIVQGLALRNPRVPIVDVGRQTAPFLLGRTAAGGVMVLGFLCFAVAVGTHVAGGWKRRIGGRQDRAAPVDRAAMGILERREAETAMIGTPEGRKS
ncbi:MAG: cbb3-type cytochrome c oxidase subunit I [Isosphaeraceae bacterium]